MIDFKCDYEKYFPADALSKRIAAMQPLVQKIIDDDFGGWLRLPHEYNKEEFERIRTAAAKINSDSDYLVCIGIGGSYLGHRAVIEALGGEKGRTKILYAGKPDKKCFIFESIFNPLLPFAVLWGLFDMFFIGAAFSSDKAD